MLEVPGLAILSQRTDHNVLQPFQFSFIFLFYNFIFQREKRIPWTDKLKAELSESLARNFANDLRLGCPISETHVPTGIAEIGSWSTGKELEECLKYLQIPEK